MPQTTPVVSVIIPNYNHSLYLEQRIESVLHQTFQDFELIILDDFSTDSSKEIIDKYVNHPKVSHVVFNDENSGSTFIQWETGFRLAKGDYIWLAESDDYADATFLEKLVGELQKDTKAVLAFSHSNIIDAQGEALPQDWDRVKQKKRTTVSIFEGTDFITARMLFNNSIYNASMVVFRKSTIFNINNQYAQLRYSGDWLFWIDVCMQGKVIRYNEKLSYFRQHEQKVTPRAEAKGIRFIEGKIVLSHLFKELKMTGFQQKVIVGRLVKSLLSSKRFESKLLKETVYREIVSFFGTSRLSIFIYEFDKRFNFSKLSIQKNRYR